MTTADLPERADAGRLPATGAAVLDPAGPALDTPAPAGPGEAATEGASVADGGFQVSLAQFEGPFDLLLHLIGRQRLDVTVLALHQVTDDFLAWINAQGSDWPLEEATAFLVVAATLLDLKAARLLPSAQVEDEDDIAALEARDLLFARLLQYRAFKEAAAWLAESMAHAGRRHPRTAGIDPAFAGLQPEVVLHLSPERFAALAALALSPKPAAVVGLGHLHIPAVSVQEQARLLADRLRRHGSSSFRQLIADADSRLVVVGRFLALLELFREGAVAFEQVTPLGDLIVRWVAGAEPIVISAEFDDDVPRTYDDESTNVSVDTTTDQPDRTDPDERETS